MVKIKKRKLTLKQRMWLKELSKTLSPTESAFRVYNCKNRNIARVIACENLTKLNVSLMELMKKMGLDDEQDMIDLKRLREAKTTKFATHEGKICDSEDVEDNGTQLKALELSLRLKGKLVKDGVNVAVTNNNVISNVRNETVYVFSSSRKEVEANAEERVQSLHDGEGSSGHRCEEAL